MNTIPAALRQPPHRTRRRTFALSLFAAVAGSLALASGASADLLTPESGGSPNADDIDTLYKIILGISIIVFVGVEGALFYALFKYKARKGAVAAQIRGNTRLEIGWTAGAAVILVILAAITFVMLDDIRNPPNSDADGFEASNGSAFYASAFNPEPPNGKTYRIQVNGQQYVWRYTYPDGKTPLDKDQDLFDNVFNYEEMVVPTGTTIVLDIEAQDVAHSWWIPKLGGKFDAVPGHTNHTWFKISKPGIYTGQCAELCGRNHANMTARVRAVSPTVFENWLADKRSEIDDANAQAKKRRAELDSTSEQQEQQAGEAAEGDVTAEDGGTPTPEEREAGSATQEP